jgi:pyrroloquinoline quinone biosynthesis protein B
MVDVSQVILVGLHDGYGIIGDMDVAGWSVLIVVALLVLAANARPEDTPASDDPFVVVLGVAQDAGFPQAGCTGACCADAWNDSAQRKHIACLGIVDPASGQRWMIEATPDFRAQLRMLDAVQPPAQTPGLDGVLLTHGHIGHYTGLMFLGHESIGAKGVPVYAMPRMRKFLSEHGPWDQLVSYGNIDLRPIEAGEPFALNERITVTALSVPHREEYTEAVAFRIDGPTRKILFVPDIDKWDRWDLALEEVLADVDVAYVDGTFYADGELPGRDMSKIPHPFIAETMARLAPLDAAQRAKVRFIHLNHTNPALQPQSDARDTIEARGFHVADEGERLSL